MFRSRWRSVPVTQLGTTTSTLLISIGGGSATGLAKAVALTTGLPIVAVPTTYAGSEATRVWGMTEAGRKDTGTDLRVLPETVVYDAALTQRLPVDLSVASGLNALAHSVDAMWAPRADPVNAVLAGEAIRALRIGLSAVVDGANRPGRPRADPLRRLPFGGRVRIGGLGPASQDLPCARRHVRPAPCADARRGAAARAGVQRTQRACGRTAHRRGVRRAERARRPAPHCARRSMHHAPFATSACRGRIAAAADADRCGRTRRQPDPGHDRSI